MQEQIEELIKLITKAFENVRREDGVSLHEARVIDDYGSTEERRKARLLDTDERWQDVPAEVIEEYYSILSFGTDFVKDCL